MTVPSFRDVVFTVALFALGRSLAHAVLLLFDPAPFTVQQHVDGLFLMTVGYVCGKL